DERLLLRLAAAGGFEPAIARRARLAALLGRDFAENSVEIDAERGGFRLTGLIGLPTLNRAAPRDQSLIANGRPVRAKLLVGAGIPAPSPPRFAFPPPDPSLALAESANNFLRPAEEAPATETRLGTPRAQLHRTYILAETPTGIVLVDQHAAHERLVYERMKEALATQGVGRQALLLPEIVELDETAAARLAARAE